jgi:DNA-binding NtrC family response regulator
MIQSAVLLFNLEPGAELNRELRCALDRRSNGDFRVEESAAWTATAAGDELRDAIRRVEPGVVCLVAPKNKMDAAARLVASVRDSRATQPVMVVTDERAPEATYQLLNAGAADFVTPPLRDCEILPRLWRLLQQSAWTDAGAVDKPVALRTLVGRSKAFVTQVDRIPSIANCDATVLVCGETGTGKELFARAIHNLSSRGREQFVPVNCGAIPLELVENELFGHDRGAYTGAGDTRPGLIAEADGGTLFLDEIDSLPLLAQVKLLRFLQDKEYRALGSTKTKRANVRVVAATNTEVDKAVQQGRLRQDLYYRLNIVTVALPPLRKRPDDVLLLAHHFLHKHSMALGRFITSFAPEAQHKLLLHHWPGNVRELEHAVERAVALAPGSTIQGSDLTLAGEGDRGRPLSFREAKAKVVQEFERTYLESLLQACHGNISHAAEVAGKDRRAFWELLRKNRIDVRSFKPMPPVDAEGEFEEIFEEA